VTARDRLHGLPGEYTYVRCSCGLVFQNPRVVTEDLPLLYPAAEYAPHQATDEWDAPHVPQWLESMPGLGRFVRETTWVVAAGQRVAERLAARARWLDVGCGNGSYLAYLRERFDLDLVGVDFAPAAVHAARRAGLTVHEGTVQDLPAKDGAYDVVSMWWTLEHLPDPKAEIRRARDLLKPGGSLLVSVPNVASLNARVFGRRWHHLDAPRHLTLWTPSTLRRLIQEHGFDLRRISFDRAPWGMTGSLGHKSVPLKIVTTPVTVTAGLLHVGDTMVAESRSMR
jgi:2-polyprenyl-3-methyl-5-hydroxy-6-metoxy-1,4-benzoquinol methylase